MSNWAWVGWLIGALSLLVGFVYFRLNRKVARIRMYTEGSNDLLSQDYEGDPTKPIRVLVGGHEVLRPRVVRLSIVNRGTVGLETNKMFRRFTFTPSEGRIISAVAYRDGAKVDVLPVGAHGNYQLAGTLINPGVEVICELLVDGDGDGDVTVTGEAVDFDISSGDEDRARAQTYMDLLTLPTALGPFGLVPRLLLRVLLRRQLR